MNTVIQFFPQDTPAFDVLQWWQTDLQFRRYNRKSHFDYVRPHCDLYIEDSEPFFPHDTLPCTTVPSLVKNSSAVQEISSRHNRTQGQDDRRTDRRHIQYIPSEVQNVDPEQAIIMWFERSRYKSVREKVNINFFFK